MPRLRVGFADGTFVVFIIIYLDEKRGDFEKCCQPFTFGAKKNIYFMLYWCYMKETPKVEVVYLRVLIVDDDRTVLEDNREYFEKMGYETVCEDTAGAAE